MEAPGIELPIAHAENINDQATLARISLESLGKRRRFRPVLFPLIPPRSALSWRMGGAWVRD